MSTFPAVKHTFHSAAGATGNGTALTVAGLATIGIQIEGVTTATLTFQGTIDGTTWYSVQAMNVADGSISTTATADGLFVASVAGLDQFRVALTWTAGAITVTGRAMPAEACISFADVAGTVTIGSALPAGTNNIGDVDVLTVPAALQGPGNPVVDSFSSAVVNLAASTADQSLVAAPGADHQIWVYGLFMMADTAAGTVTLQDEDNTALSGTMAVSDEGGWVLPMSGNFAMPWIKVATNKALEADTGACTVDGILTYAVVSV